MAFKSEEITIDEYTFQINTMPFGPLKQVYYKASPLLLIKTGDSGSFENSSALTASVFMDVDQDALDLVINKLAEYSKVKQAGGEWLDLAKQKEVVFAGSMDLMFKWLDKALEVNFSGPLADLRAANGKQVEGQKTPESKSRKK